MIKGTIALDIDGTLTADSKIHAMPSVVADFLAKLALEGWRLVFITGRSFSAGFRILNPLPFPYFLAVQNGAILLEMPSKRILSKKYLDKSIFSAMDEICSDLPSDFVIYSGFEYDDEVFYRPHKFSEGLIHYLEERKKSFHEVWTPVKTYDELKMHAFPSIKCFGMLASASETAKRIEEKLGLHVPLIKDPFDHRYFVVQATHPEITKGQALLDLLEVLGKYGPVIAAGDDLNDIPMLLAADLKIAMANAPKELLQIADIIAPPASEYGIIKALTEAVEDRS